MAFTINMSGTTEVDDSILKEFDQQFIIAAKEMNVMDQFVSYRKQIGAESIKLPKYDQLSLDTTPLVEKDDVDSEAMADAEILFTPAEYGKVVTTTQLANLQSGGTADRAAARLVGMHQGRLYDRLAIEGAIAGVPGGQVLTANGGAESTLLSSDVLTPSFLNKLYNKLARSNIQPLPGGEFVAVMHDDLIHDLRNEAGSGSWQDINKFSRPEDVLRNEVGRISGFRIVRDNNIFPNADAGDALVDTYDILCLGFNALGKAESLSPTMVMSGPFDKLQRFVNLGWKGVVQYGVVDSDAIYLGKCASSVGANA